MLFRKLLTSVFFLLILILLSCSQEEQTATNPQSTNHPPQITNYCVVPALIIVNDIITLCCDALDIDGDSLTFTWSASGGSFPNGNVGSHVEWEAPENAGNYSFTVNVSDGIESANGSFNFVVEKTTTGSIVNVEQRG